MDLDDPSNYLPLDKAVCARCVSDGILVSLIEQEIGDGPFSYCGEIGPE